MICNFFLFLLFCSFFVSYVLSATPSPTQTTSSCVITARNSSSPYAATTTSYDRRTDKTKLKIITYNVEFLFTSNYSCSSSTLNCPSSECPWNSTEEANDHLNTIASNIITLNGDIVIMPETQDCCTLDYFMSLIPSSMGYHHYLIRGTDTYTGENIGLLTKIDPLYNLQRTSLSATYPKNGSNCTGTYGSDYQSISKNLIANFSVENFPNFTLMGVHLLAQPTNPSRCGQREAQADIISTIVNMSQFNYNNEMVVLGDFNDFDLDYLDVDNNVPITKVFQYVKSSGKGLINTSQYLNQSQRFTHWTQSSYKQGQNCSFRASSLAQYDYILLSSKLNNMLESIYINQSMCGVYASDHYPLIVTLSVNASSSTISPTSSPTTLSTSSTSSSTTSSPTTSSNSPTSSITTSTSSISLTSSPAPTTSDALSSSKNSSTSQTMIIVIIGAVAVVALIVVAIMVRNYWLKRNIQNQSEYTKEYISLKD